MVGGSSHRKSSITLPHSLSILSDAPDNGKTPTELYRGRRGPRTAGRNAVDDGLDHH